MRFYFDESGLFQPARGADDIATVVGVAVPSVSQASFDRAMAACRATLGLTGARELKGSALDANGRYLVCATLDRLPHVHVRPVIIHLRHFSSSALQRLRAQFSEPLKEIPKLVMGRSAERDWKSLGDWERNLSDQQFLKIYAWSVCLDHLLRDELMEPVPEEQRPHWDTFRIVFDGRSDDRTRREGLFFSLMTQYWSITWAHLRPLPVAQLHRRDHPLNDRFGRALNIQRLVEESLAFEPSHTSSGIQAADVCASVVRRAAQSRGTDPDALRTYGRLMKSVRMRNGLDIGLATPIEDAPRPTEFEPLLNEYHLAQIRRAMDDGIGSIMAGPSLGEYPIPIGRPNRLFIECALMNAGIRAI